MSLFRNWFSAPRPAEPPSLRTGAGTPAPLGIVAGRGLYPVELCRAAKQAGVPRVAVCALVDEADSALATLADHAEWIHVGQLRRTMDYFHKQGVKEVMFAGQVRPGRLFGGIRPDFAALRILWRLKERNAHSIFGAIADLFEKDGLRVLPAVTYLDNWLAGEGTLGRRKPGRCQTRDLEFGIRIATESSRLDIGQTVVVKNGTVLAVEAFEGTDKAIRRGGELGRGGVTVVKLAKPGHDMRFDVPCIGMNTVESLKAAKAKTLAVQAGMTLFLDRTAVLDALDAAGIAVIGFKP
jgi:DUF1009 family protein